MPRAMPAGGNSRPSDHDWSLTPKLKFMFEGLEGRSPGNRLGHSREDKEDRGRHAQDPGQQEDRAPHRTPQGKTRETAARAGRAAGAAFWERRGFRCEEI